MEESETTPREVDEYVERPSLAERISNIFYAILGNGYEIFTKPHTATWLVLFIAVAYYICFVFKAGMMCYQSVIVERLLYSVRAGVALVCIFIIVFGANQV